MNAKKILRCLNRGRDGSVSDNLGPDKYYFPPAETPEECSYRSGGNCRHTGEICEGEMVGISEALREEYARGLEDALQGS